MLDTNPIKIAKLKEKEEQKRLDAMIEKFMNNATLKRAGATVQLTRKQVQEFARCSNDPIYFIKKYIKIVNLDEGLVGFKMYPKQEEMVNLCHNNNRIILKAGRQTGKALDINTPIPTPNGWSTMGNLKVGDEIFGTDGKITKVTFATEIMYDHDCYNITFDNGEVITADADHLWEVVYGKREKKIKVLTTKELVEVLNNEKNKKRGISIKLPEAIDFNSNEQLPIHPYVLGLWLGDGDKNSSTISCSYDDYKEYSAIIKKLGYEVSDFRLDKRTTITGRFTIYGIRPKLKELGILGNKKIPISYIMSPIEHRINLIQGLMDSDGTSCSRGGSCVFYQKDLSLIDQVREILSSLGIKTRITFKHVNEEKYYNLTCSTRKIGLFKLSRKVNNQKLLQNNYQLTNLYIKSIEKTESVPVRCIQVNSENHLFLCGKTYIPTHNTTTIAVGYLIHYALFNETKTIAILANKESTAIGILSRLKVAYSNLPLWMQQGVSEWSKKSILLENGTILVAGSTSGSAARSQSINLLYLDEFAFVPSHVADEFFTSVYPTISSGKTTKVIITSTPNGMNLFYKLYTDAMARRNGFVIGEYDWRIVPWRDEKWEKDQRSVLGDEKFEQEHECHFLGSAGTLISGKFLRTMSFVDPIAFTLDNKMRIYEKPQLEKSYILIADSSYGKELDYSACVVVDITQTPYRVVAQYRDNTVSAQLYPNILSSIAKHYNNAWIFAENNDIGAQVLHILTNDIEYENVIYTSEYNADKKVSLMTGTVPGVRTTPKVKRQGCNALKTIIESNTLIIEDFDIIEELSTFIAHRNKLYAADDGKNDDLVMCLVLFGWLTTQQYFKDLTNTDIRKQLYDKRAEQLENELLPAPIEVLGTEKLQPQKFVEDGVVWETTTDEPSIEDSHFLAFNGRWSGF